MKQARIKLTSPSRDKLNNVTDEIVDVSEEYDASVSGPTPLPTQTLQHTVRKAPSGDGTETVERWEMRVHKRIIDISESERALRQVMRVHVPKGVSIEVELQE